MNVVARLPHEKLRLVNRPSGSTGCATWDCRRTNSTRAMAPPTKGAQIAGCAQPKVPCSMSANTTPPRPTTTRTALARSTEAPSWRTSRCSRRDSNHRLTAIGNRLTAKAARHDTRSMKPPPMSGPISEATDVQPVQVPIARACAASLKLAMISANELGTNKAPAAPWAARSAITISTVGATAMAAEVSPNPIRPQRRTRRRPKASESAPAIRIRAPRVIR